MLPAIFQDAQWHCVTPVCPSRNRIGLAIAVNGVVHRFALDERSARHIVESMSDYLNSPAGIHFDMSSLMTSDASSAPSDGVNT